MGRKSIFPDDDVPEYPEGDISATLRRQIRNRRHYLGHRERIKFLNKLYYRTHKQQQVEGHRRWRRPAEAVVGPLTKGDEQAAAELQAGRALYIELKTTYYKELARAEICD